MDKDRKEFKDKQSAKLLQAMAQPAQLQALQPEFLKNIQLGSALYIEPAVDVVKIILKKKDESVQTKYNALMFLKDCMDIRDKKMASYCTKKILTRLKELAKLSIKPDRDKLFKSSDPQSVEEFYNLLLECLSEWQVYFQIEPGTTKDPSQYKKVCSELLDCGVRFPTTFKHFKRQTKQQQPQQQPQQSSSSQSSQKPPQQATPTSTPTPKPKQQPTKVKITAIDKLNEWYMACLNYMEMIGEAIAQDDTELQAHLEYASDLTKLANQAPEFVNQLYMEEQNITEQMENLINDVFALIPFLENYGTTVGQLKLGKLKMPAFRNKTRESITEIELQLKYKPKAPKQPEKPTFQEQQVQYQEQQKKEPSPPQVVQDDNPFFFNQVANFEAKPYEAPPFEPDENKPLPTKAQSQQVKAPEIQQIQPQISQPEQRQIKQEQPKQSEWNDPQWGTQVREPSQSQQWENQHKQSQQWENQPIEQPQWNSQPIEQPQWGSQPIEQPQWNSQPIEQPQWGNQPIEQPQWNSQPIEQPQWSSQPIEQPQWGVQPTEQPQWGNQDKEIQPQQQWGDKQSIERGDEPPKQPQNRESQWQVRQSLEQQQSQESRNPPQQLNWNVEQPHKEHKNPFEEQPEQGWEIPKQRVSTVESRPRKPSIEQDYEWQPKEQIPVKSGEEWQQNDWQDKNPFEQTVAPKSRSLKKVLSQDNQFDQFSKVFNQSDFKTPDMESKAPFSDIFGYQVGDMEEFDRQMNLENMVSHGSVEDGFNWNNPDKQEQKRNPFSTGQLDREDTIKSERQSRHHTKVEEPVDITQDEQKSFTQQGGTQNLFPTDFSDFTNFGQTKKLHVLNPIISSPRQLGYYQIDPISVTIGRKYHSDIGTQKDEKLTSTLKVDPKQELRHQQEKEDLLRKVKELQEQLTASQEQQSMLSRENEQFKQQFQVYRAQSQKQDELSKHYQRQYITLAEENKHLIQNNTTVDAENKRIQQENIELSEQLTEIIQNQAQSKIYQENLANTLNTLTKQFNALKIDHKCPIQSYMCQFFKMPKESVYSKSIAAKSEQLPQQNNGNRVNIRYDSSLFLQIYRGCEQPYSCDLNTFKYALLQQRAVLYDDRHIQIGVITKQGQELGMMINLLNKSTDNQTISDIKLNVPSNNMVTKTQIPKEAVLQRRSAYKFNLLFTYTEMLSIPILEFRVQELKYHILLPVAMIKFMAVELNDLLTLRSKWKDNKLTHVTLLSKIQRPNSKFLSQLKDFKKYFPNLTENKNGLMGFVNIDHMTEIGLKIKQLPDGQFNIKMQTSQLGKQKGEDILQSLLFLFNQ